MMIPVPQATNFELVRRRGILPWITLCQLFEKASGQVGQLSANPQFALAHMHEQVSTEDFEATTKDSRSRALNSGTEFDRHMRQ